MEDIKKKASNALKRAALNHTAKHYLLSTPPLFNLLLKGAKRYIGGETLVETVETLKNLNAANFATSIEFMGESVGSVEDASQATKEFMHIINAIKADKLDAVIGLDLSHIGLTIDPEMCYQNLKILAQATEHTNIDIIISAEDLTLTSKIIETYLKMSAHYSHIGITLQAYLYRTPKDLDMILAASRGKIRLVKGAFATPTGHSMDRGSELDDQYLKLAERVLLSGRKLSIATHDTNLLNNLKTTIAKHGIAKANYEFEMLYGIRPDLMNELAADGYPCRQYIVYGKEWYLYVCNRIAEHPDNVFQFIIDVMEK